MTQVVPVRLIRGGSVDVYLRSFALTDLLSRISKLTEKQIADILCMLVLGIEICRVISKSLSVNNIDTEWDLAKGDNGSRKVVESKEAALEFLVTHQ